VTRILLVGLGSIGQRHLRNLQTFGTFEYVALRSRGQPLPDEFSALPLRVVTTLDEAVAAQPDVAFLCAPSTAHPAVLGRLVRETRCHVFIEKPMAPSLEGLADCARLLEEQGRKSLVGYNLRCHPVWTVVQDAVRQRVLGQVSHARVSVGQYLPDWHPHEDYRHGYSASRRLGGGVMLDLIHEIDLLYSWFGKPEVVKAVAGKISALDIDTEDTAEILCRFTSGVIGSIHMDYVQRVPMRTGAIVGDEGTLTYDLLKPECQVHRPGVPPAVYAFPEFVRNDMYVAELTRFFEAIRGDTPCSPSLREGIDVLEIALRAKHDAGVA
jgi:predicted dehydrogenase